MRHDIGVDFIPSFSACREDNRVLLCFKVHRRIAEREELVARLETGKTWFLSRFHTTKEGLHGPIQSEVDLRQELAVDAPEFRVVLFALS